MTDQTEHFDDELLSAYVDGELTGEQLALVEQRLADDPSARQLVDELRALSHELQALPQQTLGDDLTATIMQRAERSMLLGAESQSTLRTSDEGASRRWVWAATAIAAALLLMFVTP
ncbi:MAG: anti-sigma factor family protein, partial [Bythopirellula sp.]